MDWAEFWSPATRDLALRENDQPYRRSLYIRVGAVMLCSMAMVTAISLFCVTGRLIEWRWTTLTWAAMTFFAGVVVMCRTYRKTHRYLLFGPAIKPKRPRAVESSRKILLYLLRAHMGCVVCDPGYVGVPVFRFAGFQERIDSRPLFCVPVPSS
jgi:hypothetical protein